MMLTTCNIVKKFEYEFVRYAGPSELCFANTHHKLSLISLFLFPITFHCILKHSNNFDFEPWLREQ